jgi:hypothetical protein
MTSSMQETTDLYDAAAGLQVRRLCVESEELRRFSVSVREVQQQLGKDAADSYWRPVVARLRRIRWELATVPLPLAHPAFGIADGVAFLAERLRDCDRVFPDYASAAYDTIVLLEELGRSGEDPLGDAVRALRLPPEASVLVLRDQLHVLPVEQALAGPARIAVATPTQLARAPLVYGDGAVIGPASWFPREVFAAPKALRIEVIQFAWLRDPAVTTGLFAGGEMGPGGEGSLLADYSGRGKQGTNLGSADLIPITDWAAIASRTGGAAPAGEERADTVEAYLLLLASGEAVYLEAEEGSRAYVVELGTVKELQMVPTRSIVPGMYVVVRVGGEGDYIPAIADALLGERAPLLRGAQQRWKERLRQQVASDGTRAVLSRLVSAGAPRASRANLRRWASPTSIRTEDYADFDALMKVVGLEGESKALWSDMDLIDQAHLKAGQSVRKLLVREILNGDTGELETSGWQDYDVAEIEGEGALRVARVEASAPGTLRVPPRQTRMLVQVERDLWQG